MLSSEKDGVEIIPTITEVRVPGRRGRPRKQFNEQLLKDALAPHRKISVARLARVLHVHPNTLRAHLKLHGNRVYSRFSDITDAEIDILIRWFRHKYPKSGIRYATGYLRSNSIRVPKRRVLSSMKRVNPVGQRLRIRATIKRREYRVSRPDALWHMDGHHKLISWGIVIHGFIDGYSRKVRRSILNLVSI
jgi:hypothetical protein